MHHQHHNYPALLPGLQHLAYLHQQRTLGDHNPWAAEAALEGYLQVRAGAVTPTVLQQHQSTLDGVVRKLPQSQNTL